MPTNHHHWHRIISPQKRITVSIFSGTIAKQCSIKNLETTSRVSLAILSNLIAPVCLKTISARFVSIANRCDALWKLNPQDAIVGEILKGGPKNQFLGNTRADREGLRNTTSLHLNESLRHVRPQQLYKLQE